MEQLNALALKVLCALEPDPDKRGQWTKKLPLYPVSQCEAVRQFVSRIELAAQNHEKVMVAGDYDCDGVLATAIMVAGLKKKGLETGYYIPDRIKEGYGLAVKTVEAAAKKGYSLLITVDNGVHANQALEKAKELGLDVMVTDHHLYESRPDCLVLVHPALMEEPFSSLCGAAVAYECMRALHLDDDRMLMEAAAAAVGDCMAVTGETRALIQNGVDLLNKTKEPHLTSLCKEHKLDESTIAFQIVPRINAVGRLANLANVNNVVRYFLSQSPAAIQSFSSQMNDLNDQRKRLSEQTYARASLLVKPYHAVLLAADPSFHEGIIGLAAGMLSSQYRKPAIVGAIGEEGIKCSMRAPAGFRCLEFLEGFEHYSALGGHDQAAGFTIEPGFWPDFEKFARAKASEISWTIREEMQIPIDPEEITADEVESLDALRPFGTGFPAPKFRIDHPQIAGSYDLSQARHRKFTLKNGLECLNFNQSSTDLAAPVQSIAAFVGTLSVSRYQGRKKPNFLIDEIVYNDHS